MKFFNETFYEIKTFINKQETMDYISKY